MRRPAVRQTSKSAVGRVAAADAAAVPAGLRRPADAGNGVVPGVELAQQLVALDQLGEQLQLAQPRRALLEVPPGTRRGARPEHPAEIYNHNTQTFSLCLLFILI